MPNLMTWGELKALIDNLSEDELEEPVTIDLDYEDDFIHVNSSYYAGDGHRLILYGY